MNVYSATTVTMAEGYANEREELVIVATEEVDLTTRSFVYDSVQIDKHTLYWAEKDGFVSFFAHDPTNEHGFGGRDFILPMKDGSTVTIKGPWSSRCSVMNEFFPHSVEVNLKTPRFTSMLSTYVTVPFAELMASTIGANVNRDGLRYDIT